jgi:hypothetical protein
MHCATASPLLFALGFEFRAALALVQGTVKFLRIQTFKISNRSIDREWTVRFFNEVVSKRRPNYSINTDSMNPRNDGLESPRMAFGGYLTLHVVVWGSKANSSNAWHVLTMSQILDCGLKNIERAQG